MSPRGRRPRQLIGVPTSTRGEDDDLHLFGLHSDQSVQSTRGELSEIVGNFLETGSGHALLECFSRREVELGLTIARWGRAIEIRVELGQLRTVKADLVLVGGDEREVSVGIVALERGRVLRGLVDYRDNCRRSIGGA